MRHTKTLKLVATSMIASAILVGCSSSSNDNVTNSGVAIDPQLQGATVFLDLNKNGLFNSGEPSTTTDNSGNYSLTMNRNQVGIPLVIKGGIDLVTKNEFTGRLSVISENGNAKLHITPLTTLVNQAKLANPTKDVNTIKSDLATQLNISVSDIDKNIVEAGNEGLLQIALRIQKMAQGIVDSNSTSSTIGTVYANIAGELETHDLATALNNVLNKEITDTSSLEYAKLQDLDNELKLVDHSALNADELALSMDNIDNNISATTASADLNATLYNNANMIVSNATDVQIQRKERAFKALGLSTLTATQKDDIVTKMQATGVNFEEDSPKDMIKIMTGASFGYTWDANQTATLKEMLTRYDTMGSDYETEMNIAH